MKGKYREFENEILDIKNEECDIIFLDPPYESEYDINALKIIIESNMLSDDGIIILETDQEKGILIYMR